MRRIITSRPMLPGAKTLLTMALWSLSVSLLSLALAHGDASAKTAREIDVSVDVALEEFQKR